MHLTPSISLRNYRLAGDIAAYIRNCCRTGNMETVSIDRLTKKFAISATPLKNAFKQRYRQTIHAYVLTWRIQFICELLDTNNYSIKEIAYHAGYIELSNFSRDFTRQMGISPREYRQRTLRPQQLGELIG